MTQQSVQMAIHHPSKVTVEPDTCLTQYHDESSQIYSLRPRALACANAPVTQAHSQHTLWHLAPSYHNQGTQQAIGSVDAGFLLRTEIPIPSTESLSQTDFFVPTDHSAPYEDMGSLVTTNEPGDESTLDQGIFSQGSGGLAFTSPVAAAVASPALHSSSYGTSPHRMTAIDLQRQHLRQQQWLGTVQGIEMDFLHLTNRIFRGLSEPSNLTYFEKSHGMSRDRMAAISGLSRSELCEIMDADNGEEEPKEEGPTSRKKVKKLDNQKSHTHRESLLALVEWLPPNKEEEHFELAPAADAAANDDNDHDEIRKPRPRQRPPRALRACLACRAKKRRCEMQQQTGGDIEKGGGARRGTCRNCRSLKQICTI